MFIKLEFLFNLKNNTIKIIKERDKNSIAVKIAKRILLSFIIIILVMVLMFFMLGIF